LPAPFDVDQKHDSEKQSRERETTGARGMIPRDLLAAVGVITAMVGLVIGLAVIADAIRIPAG
jgi:hypothetical protein